MNQHNGGIESNARGKSSDSMKIVQRTKRKTETNEWNGKERIDAREKYRLALDNRICRRCFKHTLCGY